MHSSGLLPLAMLCFKAIAFDITSYDTEECTGLGSNTKLEINDGCQTPPGSGARAVIIPWKAIADNNLLLATYSTERCCHADLIDTFTWTEECTPFTGEGVRSWRVIDPEDPDKGIQEQRSDYACDNCGLDGCGKDAVWIAELD